ncbi:MAG: VOC family protein [Acidobacteriota bacterium]|nr:VOC family protein [Acidobacteriota bacterium]MDE3189831.1 VOC family protein [Acidobacteriota bacterium]
MAKGEVVHYEIAATDVDRARRFWEGVFGWSFGESMSPELDYRMARVGDAAGAAITPGEPGNPHVYLDTDDIDASIAKVRELGGEAAAKQPVPTHGWFAACTDSEGNTFFLWQGDATAG